MRKLTCTVLCLALSLLFTSRALAWGNDGHKTVGEVAALYLAADNKTGVLAHIKEVLKGETLGEVATWADQIKRKKFNPQHPSGDPDLDDFLKKTPNSRVWHFVDLPLGCSDYDNCKMGSSNKSFGEDTDIVQMIRTCVRRLQGQTDPQHPMNERNALRMLVHLMGDLHQPLHVGVRFMRADEENGTFRVLTNPADIGDVAKSCSSPTVICSDVGGNLLLLYGSDSTNLHAYWDESLVESAMEKAQQDTPPDFASFLFQNVPPASAWDGTGGDPRAWPVQWANDTLRLSRERAYKEVDVTGMRRADPFGQGSNDTLAFDITKPRKYRADNVPVVERQLTKGGYRLAKLLEAVYKNF